MKIDDLTNEQLLDVYAHTEQYAAEIAQSESIAGDLLTIVSTVKALAKKRILKLK